MRKTYVCAAFLIAASTLINNCIAERAELKNEKALFSFVQISDTHIIAGKPTHIVEKGIKAINALVPQPEFVIDTGDLIDGPPEKGYDKYNELFTALKAPHYSVVGNHDYRKKIYQAKRGKLNYSFNVEPYHFIVLDNIEFKPETDAVCGGGFPQASIDWLGNHLKSVKPETPLIIFAHAALFRPHSFSKDLPGDVYNYQEIISLIKPFNVIAFFAGHAHTNAKITKNNIDFITTGCMSDNRTNHNCEVGFRIVDVYKNSVKSVYVPLVNTSKEE